jgi:adenylylsulfate kinase-like enzyme
VIVFTSFISPYRADRDLVRAIHDPGRFVEAYVPPASRPASPAT